jgi:hypothetical protein
MPADTSVKFLHSAMTGAPTITGAVGCIVSLLDACLVNGFGTGTVDSIVVSNNLATVTRAAGHPMEVGAVALIAGATPTGLNGEKKVLSVTTTTYTFEATGISNQTATGTITHKLAPLGWGKPFSSTNIGVYRSNNIQGTQAYLRVNDSHSGDGSTNQNAGVRGYESMTDVSTGTGMFPTLAQSSVTASNWAKDFDNGTTPREWVIVGDDRMFYFWHIHRGNPASANDRAFSHTNYFGDFISFKSPDPFGCTLNYGNAPSADEQSYGMSLPYSDGGVSNTHCIARSPTGIGSSSIAIRRMSFLQISNQLVWSGYTSGGQFPNTSDFGLNLYPAFILDSSPYNIRGRYPGVYFTDQPISAVFAHREYVTGVNALPGKTLRVIYNNRTTWFVDTTGPWR